VETGVFGRVMMVEIHNAGRSAHPRSADSDASYFLRRRNFPIASIPPCFIAAEAGSFRRCKFACKARRQSRVVAKWRRMARENSPQNGGVGGVGTRAFAALPRAPGSFF